MRMYESACRSTKGWRLVAMAAVLVLCCGGGVCDRQPHLQNEEYFKYFTGCYVPSILKRYLNQTYPMSCVKSARSVVRNLVSKIKRTSFSSQLYYKTEDTGLDFIVVYNVANNMTCTRLVKQSIYDNFFNRRPRGKRGKRGKRNKRVRLNYAMNIPNHGKNCYIFFVALMNEGGVVIPAP